MTTQKEGHFEFRPGFRFSGDADAIGRALDEIKQRRTLDGEAVVEAAADPDSPMHHLIEWDDKKAARLHRIHTGSKIIRSLQFVTGENEQKETRIAFLNIPAEHGGRGDYRHPDDPMSMAERERAWRLLNGMLSGVMAALRDLEESVGVPGDPWADRAPKMAQLRQQLQAAGATAAEIAKGD